MKRIVSLLLALLIVLAALPAFAESGGRTAADADHTIRILRNFSNNDMENDPAAERIWDLTGYRVVYDFLPAEDPDSRLTLLLASGTTDYDMVRVRNIAAYYEYATSGVLSDLTDHILNSNYYKLAFTEEEKSIFDKYALDGVLYGIASPQAPAIDTGYFIRKDWLDTQNLAMPKTTDELLEVLRALKVAYPEATPFSIAGDLYPNLVAPAFGVDAEHVDIDGVLYNRVELADRMKPYLTYMNTLFNEGLLDKEFIVNNGAVINEQVFNGYVGVWGWDVWGMQTYNDTFAQYMPDAEYAMLNIPTKDGYAGVYATAGYNGFHVIPKAVESSADKVFDYLNKFYEETNYCAIYDGYEGIHYEYDANGVMMPIQPAFGEGCSNGDFVFGMGRTWNLKYWTVRLQKQEQLYKWYMEMQSDADKIVTDPLDAAAPIESRIELGDELWAYASENITKFICGERPIDEYNDFLDGWYEIGGRQVMADINAWYNAE